MGFFGRSQKRNRFSLSRGGGARASGSLTDASDGSSRRNSTVAQQPPPQSHQSTFNTNEAPLAQPTPAPPPTPERTKSLKTVAFAKAQLGRAGSWRRSSITENAKYHVSTTKLGAGAYGSVMLGMDRHAGCSVAIKFIVDGRMKPSSLEREIGILRRLSQTDHPGICKMHAYLQPAETYGGDVRAEGGGQLSKALRGCHAIVMDAARGGELFEYVVKRDGLREAKSGPIFAQLVSVVQCAHAFGIVHRDLKLENVLLCGEPGEPDARHVRLVDWGLAHQHAIDADGRPIPEKLHSRCGSRSYMAPEVTNKEISSVRGYDGFEADVWSLGVCLFAIHMGFFPFEQANPDLDWRAGKVASGQLRGESTMATILSFYSERETTLSDSLVALLDRMLLFEPADRATLAEVAASPWLAPWLSPVPSGPCTVDSTGWAVPMRMGMTEDADEADGSADTSVEVSVEERTPIEELAERHVERNAEPHVQHEPAARGAIRDAEHEPVARGATLESLREEGATLESVREELREEERSQLPQVPPPTVERQDSSSTSYSTYSASSHASSQTSRLTSAGHSSIVYSVARLRQLAKLESPVEEEGSSHWAAVRYAIAGARKQAQAQRQQRRAKGNERRAKGDESPLGAHPELRHITALFSKTTLGYSTSRHLPDVITAESVACN